MDICPRLGPATTKNSLISLGGSNRVLIDGDLPKMTCLNPKPPLRDENSLELVIYFSTRWIEAGVFESSVHDLRAVLRIAESLRSCCSTLRPNRC
jgi:hypothetical protein